MKKIEKDFNKFSPIEYLKEYYINIGSENEKLLRFFDKAYKRIKKQNKLLEFGGGPTIYQIISARNKVDEIIFSDYNSENLDEITKWINEDENAFNWNSYFEFVLKLEGKPINDLKRVKLEQRNLREKIKKVIKGDAYQKNPLGEEVYKEYFDIISINFVPESATDNKKDYLIFLKNIFSLIKPNGNLIMTMLKKANYYHVGEMKFPAYPIKDEKHIKSLLNSFGFKITSIETINAEKNQGYEGMIFLTAIKDID